MASKKTANKPERTATRKASDEAPEMNIEGIEIPQGMEMGNLRPDFEPIIGFLQRPSKDNPNPVRFAGILIEAIEFTNERKQKAHWFVMVSTQDQDCFALDNDEGEIPVEKGSRVGISESGAIKALAEKNSAGQLAKKGHFVILQWTGEKIATKNGDMWEVLAQVSTKPVKDFDPTSDELPF